MKTQQEKGTWQNCIVIIDLYKKLKKEEKKKKKVAFTVKCSLVFVRTCGCGKLKDKEYWCGWLKNVGNLISKLSVAILEFTVSLGCDIDK